MPYEFKEFYDEVLVPAGYEDVRIDVDKCDSICKLFYHWYADKVQHDGSDSSSEVLWTIAKELKRLGYNPIMPTVSIGEFTSEVVDELIEFRADKSIVEGDTVPSNKLDIYPVTLAMVHVHDKDQECTVFCAPYRVDVTAVLKARP